MDHFWPFLTFLPSKWSKNGPFLDFLEIVYFFVISTQGIMGNKLRTLFHKISKNIHFCTKVNFWLFCHQNGQKWSIFGLFGDSLFFRYFHSGNHGKQLRTLFHKISKNYPLLHWSQFLLFCSQNDEKMVYFCTFWR